MRVHRTLPNLNFNESYTLTLVRGDRRTGEKSMLARTDGATELGKPYDFVGTKTFGSIDGLRAVREDLHS